MVSTKDLKCKNPKHKGTDYVYTPEERKLLLDYLEKQPDSMYSLAVMLMFCLCVRIGELQALRWSDYHEEDMILTVQREVVRRRGEDGKNHFQEVDHTKAGEGGVRDLNVSPRAAEILKRARRVNPNGERIFESINGTPFRANRFNEKLKAYCEKIDIPYRSSHKIRFFAVTEQARHGMDLTTIQYNAGHKNAETTYGYMVPYLRQDEKKETWNGILTNRGVTGKMQPFATT